MEDEQYLADAVIHLLKKADINVDWKAHGDEGLELALANNYDCMILDIMLPKMSGWDILKSVREQGIMTPVIMLSALTQVDDKVRALEMGADDYLAKPFKTAELIARIKALTRRPPMRLDDKLTFGGLEYNLTERTLNGVALTAKEAELLEIFMRQPGQVQPKASLLARVWGSDVTDSENYVEVYISALRRKFKKLHSKVGIKTVRNLGYKLVDGK